MEEDVYVVKGPPKGAKVVAEYTEYSLQGQRYLQVRMGRLSPICFKISSKGGRRLGGILWREEDVSEHGSSQERGEVRSDNQTPGPSEQGVFLQEM